MRVYHFINAQYGLENIKFRRIKLALLNELNDPFEHFAVNLKNREVRRAFEFVKDQMSKKSGFLCFSKDWKNPVQWSHYADKHRGVCLGFDVPNHHSIIPISYRHKRIAFDPIYISAENLIPKDLLEQIFTTKFSHWKYEKEVRLNLDLNQTKRIGSNYFVDFGDDLILKEVIVGCESDISRQTIEGLLARYPYKVKLTKARLAYQSFNVVTQLNRALW